jgi:hypothetical protein
MSGGAHLAPVTGLTPAKRQGPTLQRVAFKTDRLGEFVGSSDDTPPPVPPGSI